MDESLNVFDEPLEPCGNEPVTGFYRDGCCNTSSGYRSGARSSICLKDITIYPNGSFPEFLEVNHSAERAANEALNFRGSTIKLAPIDVALLTTVSGVGEHRVFGTHPAAFDVLELHPAWNAFFYRGCADYTGVAKGNENRAGSVWGNIGDERNRSEIGNSASIGSVHTRN